MSMATLAVVAVVLGFHVGRARARIALAGALLAFVVASAPWWISAAR